MYIEISILDFNSTLSASTSLSKIYVTTNLSYTFFFHWISLFVLGSFSILNCNVLSSILDIFSIAFELSPFVANVPNDKTLTCSGSTVLLSTFEVNFKFVKFTIVSFTG